MTRPTAWLQHVANGIVGGTGLAWAWALWFVEPEDPFAIVNHPWQPHFQTVHVVSAPLLVFAIGLLWPDHVWARVRSGFRARRKTGLALFALVWPMIASGYLLQVAVDEAWRAAWLWTHVVTSCVWILAYVVHQLSRRKRHAAQRGGR